MSEPVDVVNLMRANQVLEQLVATQQTEIERLRAAWHTAIEVGSEWKQERDECRRLLREVLDKAEPWENLAVYPVRLTPEWIKAAKAAGGDDE